jgi:hypothetical protein
MINPYISFPLVRDNQAEFFILILSTVLHPYYKLAYIKMAWGGPEDQARERAAGNPNAKDWHDEALKVVEAAMVSYWREPQPTMDKDSESSDKHTNTRTRPLESEFDRHRRQLIEQSSPGYGADGWASELRRYLGDLPVDVDKSTDIIQWWQVRDSFSYR